MNKKLFLFLLPFLLVFSGCKENHMEHSTYHDNSQAGIVGEEGDEGKNMETVFNCNAQRLDKNMSSQEATRLYLQMLAEGKEKGYTPVLVFADDILEESIESSFKEAGSSEAYTKSVLANDHTNGKELLDAKYAALERTWGSEFLSIDEDNLSAWLSSPARTDETTFIPPTLRFDGEAYLLQVPTAKPYEVFAWLPFCGWNECPDVDEMIAICKYWYDNYGAIPTTITYNMLIFYLEQPITDMENAVNIAKEQCAFCSEVIGMGGIESYVATTYNGYSWLFWWD